jgi:hypothetical protein
VLLDGQVPLASLVSPPGPVMSPLTPTHPSDLALGREEVQIHRGVTMDLFSAVNPSGSRRINLWLSSSTSLGRPSRTRSRLGPEPGYARTAGGPSSGASPPGSPHAADGPAFPSQTPSPPPLFTEDFLSSPGRVSPASLGGSLLSPTPPDPVDIEEERSQGGVPAGLLSAVTPSGTRPIDSWLSSSTSLKRSPRTRSLPGPDLGPALISGGPAYGASVPCSLPADDQAEVLLDGQVSLFPDRDPLGITRPTLNLVRVWPTLRLPR